MRSFQHEFQVNAPIERVSEFYNNTRVIKQLTPPPLFVKFNQIEPLSEGSRSDFTLWLGPIPIHWVAVHSEVSPFEGFTDTQVEGPFKTWVHKHIFESLAGGKTRIIDRVDGKPSDHIFWGIISRFMWLTLPILFSYRAQQTRKTVEES
jgi:ligand-binding SRPBCC domain-containing protein